MMAAGTMAQIGNAILLGGQARYIQMGRRFQRGGSTFETNDLVVFFAVLCVIVAVIWLLSRYLTIRERRGHNSPRQIFRQLCRAHGLKWADRQLLRQMARWHRLPTPSLLFLDVQRFDLKKLGPTFEARADQITAIRDCLFAEAK